MTIIIMWQYSGFSLQQVQLGFDHIKVLLIDVTTVALLHQPDLLLFTFQACLPLLRLQLQLQGLVCLVILA